MNPVFCRAGIAMGSNIEPREKSLRDATDFLRGLHRDGPFLVSSIYETSPVDCAPGTASFLNATAEISTNLPPLELLGELQKYEFRQGRPLEREKNSPRTVDLDVLYYGDMTLSAPRLELPHPRMTSRGFVMLPLAEIVPDLVLPGESHTVSELAAACSREGLHKFAAP